MKSLFHGTGSVPMDVGHLPLLARLSLPEDMRDPDISEDSYRQSLKTFSFSQCVQRIGGFFTRMRYINLHLTLTVTLTWLGIFLELNAFGSDVLSGTGVKYTCSGMFRSVLNTAWKSIND